MKILVIEDDPAIVEFLETALQIGWPEARLASASRGMRGIEMVEDLKPDIILLDLGLPDINGFDVLKRIRSFSSIPVIITTVSGEEGNVVRGLALGASDYITKPLRPLEMIARMKALIKRDSVMSDLDVECGNMHFGNSYQEFYRGNKLIRLTSTEGRILCTLMKNTGHLVTYTDLARAIWGEYYPGVEDTMKSHICHLRQKIEADPSEPKLIQNTAGVGYMFIATN